MKTEEKCIHEHAWHDGSCCCNCIHNLKLMKHPWNTSSLGKGSITEHMGFICTATFEDGSSEGEATFFEFEHGSCEHHSPKTERTK
jgi:hypothetical protein